MKRPIRLVQLVHGYPPAVGGVEFSVRDLCERLVREGEFDVTVLTTNAYTVANFFDPTLPTIPINGVEVQNGVKIHRFPVVTRWVPILQPLQSVAWKLQLPGNGILRTWFHGPICPHMLQTLRNMSADVICAASFPLNHMRYPFLLGPNSPPVVLFASTHTEHEWGFDRPNLLRLMNRSYATIAHTAHEREWLIDHGARADKIRLIAHGVDRNDLQPRLGAFRDAHGIDAGAFLIAYVGQQGGHKGIDTLLAVLPQVLEVCPSAWLVIGGARTPYSSELRRLAAMLPKHAASRIVFADNLTTQEKADLLGDCDVFASPSKAESFGITTLEAWSLAKPVIVGDSPSQREIVQHGVTGFRVSYGNEADLLSALVRLEKSQDLREMMGRKGRERQRHDFDRAVVESQYADVLREAAFSRHPMVSA